MGSTEHNNSAHPTPVLPLKGRERAFVREVLWRVEICAGRKPGKGQPHPLSRLSLEGGRNSFLRSRSVLSPSGFLCVLSFFLCALCVEDVRFRLKMFALD